MTNTSSKCTYKVQPEDFFVAEMLTPKPDENGEYQWCYVEKCGMNTAFVKRQWSRLTGCLQKDISHSGLKDRHAVTRQWLCIPLRYAEKLPDSQENNGEYWKILERLTMRKKLRIGTHRQNHFVIVLRHIEGEHIAIEAHLNTIRDIGYPNAFGEQRFGYNNLEQSMEWVLNNRLPKKPDERSRVLSTLRSAAFNAQLDARIAANNWQTILAGDRAMLSGSNSSFVVEAVDDELLARVNSGDISAGGWLIGKGEIPETGEAAQIRQIALAEHQAVVAYLMQHCESDWRALRCLPEAMNWQWQDEHTLQLELILPRGSYVTSLISTIFDETIDGSVW